MAILGDGARLSVAAELAGIDPVRVVALAHELRRIEVLSNEDPFTFVHPLVRRSVYDGIPLGERHRLHGLAADLLEASGAPFEAGAAHLTILPPAGSSHVATMHLRAAEAALMRAAPSEAAKWLERALEENAPEPARAVLLARLGLRARPSATRAASPYCERHTTLCKIRNCASWWRSSSDIRSRSPVRGSPPLS